MEISPQYQTVYLHKHLVFSQICPWLQSLSDVHPGTTKNKIIRMSNRKCK